MIILLFYFIFWLHWVFVAANDFLYLQCKDFSLQCTGSRVAGCRLNHPVVCEILVAQPGMELESPAGEDRFLSTGPARKSLCDYFKAIYLLRF